MASSKLVNMLPTTNLSYQRSWQQNLLRQECGLYNERSVGNCTVIPSKS